MLVPYNLNLERHFIELHVLKIKQIFRYVPFKYVRINYN